LDDAVGRYVFGAAMLLLGVASIALHAQLISNWRLGGEEAFIVISASVQILGAGAMFFRKTAAFGAIVLGFVSLVFTATFIPEIVSHPRVFASWGDVCYQLALVAGAAVAYGLTAPSAAYATMLCRAAVIVFGVCSISYGIEQVEFLARTVSLVPRWIPPNGMFWSIVTTIAFILGGIALIIGYKPLPAARLLALMLLLFGVALWIPILIAAPATPSNWSEGIETFAIAGVAWTMADFLAATKAAFGVGRVLQA
jgi:uncharacterized membrane protein YphA (DoxX/SURF4 family)